MTAPAAGRGPGTGREGFEALLAKHAVAAKGPADTACACDRTWRKDADYRAHLAGVALAWVAEESGLAGLVRMAAQQGDRYWLGQLRAALAALVGHDGREEGGVSLCSNGEVSDCRNLCRCGQQLRAELAGAGIKVEAPRPVVLRSGPTATPSARLWLRDRLRPIRTREDSPA